MIHRLFTLSLLLCFAAAIGCDKDSQPAPAPTAQTDDTPAAPTTQALLDAPRRDTSLKIAPLFVRVPPGWKVDVLKTASLEGMAPHGDVEIAISTLPLIDKDRVSFFQASAQDQAKQDPERFRIGAIESINGLTALETMKFRGGPATRPAGVSLPISADEMVSWNLIIFVPQSGKLVPCDFSIRMTREQYEADQQFIRAILQSAHASVSPGTS